MRGDCADDQRVAVGRRLCNLVDTQVASRAWTILDDDNAAERFLSAVCECARCSVERTAGRVGHHEADRLIRIRGLRAGRCGETSGDPLAAIVAAASVTISAPSIQMAIHVALLLKGLSVSLTVVTRLA